MHIKIQKISKSIITQQQEDLLVVEWFLAIVEPLGNYFVNAESSPVKTFVFISPASCTNVSVILDPFLALTSKKLTPKLSAIFLP